MKTKRTYAERQADQGRQNSIANNPHSLFSYVDRRTPEQKLVDAPADKAMFERLYGRYESWICVICERSHSGDGPWTCDDAPFSSELKFCVKPS